MMFTTKILYAEVEIKFWHHAAFFLNDTFHFIADMRIDEHNQASD